MNVFGFEWSTIFLLGLRDELFSWTPNLHYLPCENLNLGFMHSRTSHWAFCVPGSSTSFALKGTERHPQHVNTLSGLSTYIQYGCLHHLKNICVLFYPYFKCYVNVVIVKKYYVFTLCTKWITNQRSHCFSSEWWDEGKVQTFLLQSTSFYWWAISYMKL